MNSITQDMKFRQSLMNYAKKYGVSRASRKYNKSRSYIYFWLKRWDGSVESLAVKRLRDKLEDDTQKPKYIKTVYGIGYTWAVNG